MGWGNPVVGGTVLQIAAIQSPNFSIPGASGWSIEQDGDAFFFNITAEGTITASTFIGTDFVINSAGAFFYNGTPALGNLWCSIAPVAGSDSFGNAYANGVNVGNQAAAHLILDTSGDLSIIDAANQTVMFIYSGDGSIRLYNPGNVAAGHLATVVSPASGSDGAGNPYPRGLASLTPALGATVIDGGAAAIYTAAPALNNLFASLSGQATSDQYGNAIPQGLLMFNLGGVLAAPSTGIVAGSASGQLKYAGADGNIFNTGELHLAATGVPQTIAGGQTTITGLSCPVAAGRYRIRGALKCLMGGTASTVGLQFRGPAASSVFVVGILAAGGPFSTTSESEFIGLTALSTDFSSPTFSAGFTYYFWFEGDITFSAAGTFNLSDRATGFSHTIQSGFMTVSPVT